VEKREEKLIFYLSASLAIDVPSTVYGLRKPPKFIKLL
jgi:hypothetical protein